MKRRQLLGFALSTPTHNSPTAGYDIGRCVLRVRLLRESVLGGIAIVHKHGGIINRRRWQ